jgi:hypothetical protein
MNTWRCTPNLNLEPILREGRALAEREIKNLTKKKSLDANDARAFGEIARALKTLAETAALCPEREPQAPERSLAEELEDGLVTGDE